MVVLLVGGDAAALLLAVRITVIEGYQVFSHPWFWAYVSGLGIFLLLYRRFNPDGVVSRVDEALVVARIVVVLTMTFILVEAVFEVDLPLNARGMVNLALSYGVLSILYRGLLRSLQKFLYRFNLGTRRTLIVGTNHWAEEVFRQIKAHSKLGYDLLGFVDDAPLPPGSILQPVVGDLGALPRLIRELEVDEVIITLEKPEHEALLGLIYTINGVPVGIKILPDMYEVVTGLAKTEDVYGLPLIRINPEFITPFQVFMKRTLDIVISAVGLVVTAPLTLAIGLGVRLTSPGPAIFSQERVGCRGRRFTIHKFRTMVEHAEEHTGPVWATADDPRITPLGRFLRRARLDELPQLWNVLRGDMSMVGPRPERPHFVEGLVKEFPYYYRRLLVRPGLTGWSQARGNYDLSPEDVSRKLKDDFFYIENLSIRLDLKILLMTVWVVLSDRGH